MKQVNILLISLICYMSVSMQLILAEEQKQAKPKSVVITYTQKQITKIIPLKTTSYSTIETICKPKTRA